MNIALRAYAFQRIFHLIINFKIFAGAYERENMMQTQTFIHKKPFELECGKTLPELTITYSTFGTINENADNIIWVCHALTANSIVTEWWPGLFGENDFFSPDKYFVKPYCWVLVIH